MDSGCATVGSGRWQGRGCSDADFVDRRTRDGRNPKTDGALAPWAKLGERYRESNRQQADHIPIKLRAIGCRAVAETVVAPAVAAFDLEAVELLARMEHDRWNAEKWLSGWTAAPGDKEKDEERRTSPSMVSWEELGDGIRQYDRDAVKLIPELFRGTGMKVCRVRDLA